MPDGSQQKGKPPSWWSERLAENGAHFCKRDRNKAGSVGIYTTSARQTIRVGDTDVCAPEEIVDDAKLAEIELALGRFVLTDLEAKKRERAGVKSYDMLVRECLNVYAIARREFQDDVVRALEVKIDEAAKAGQTQLHRALTEQLPRARESARQEANTMRSIIQSIQRCWEGEGPKASEMDKTGQLAYVAAMRKIGYSDSTIKVWLVRIFTAMTHCVDEKRLIAMPERVRADKWSIKTDEDRDVVVYDIAELGKLFDAAWKRPRWWKYQNTSTHAPRPMTLVEATWLQIDLDETAPRWKLNPPGKRLTRKRRPVIPICPTLAAEMRTWTRDHVKIITNGKGSPAKTHLMFRRIQKEAGITRGSAKTMRATIRTLLAIHGVPDAIADWFVGHADEGSPTGKFYKAKLPQYMAVCVLVLEEHLYSPLRSVCKVAKFAKPAPAALAQLRALAAGIPRAVVIDRKAIIEQPFGDHDEDPTEDQCPPEAYGEAFWAALRGNCVSKTLLTA